MKTTIINILTAVAVFSISTPCFAGTEFQLHGELDRAPNDTDILTVTIQHTSGWDYGKNFFFLDIEGKDKFRPEADKLYFEYHTYFSFDKILGISIPGDFIKEWYLSGQYTDSDKDFINRAFLYGLAFDINVIHFKVLNLGFYVRDQKTQDISWQIILKWGLPFRVLDTFNLSFCGFAKMFELDRGAVFIGEPQLRLNFSSFVGKDGFLSDSAIGTEIETTYDFFEKNGGWEVNPTLFWVTTF